MTPSTITDTCPACMGERVLPGLVIGDDIVDQRCPCGTGRVTLDCWTFDVTDELDAREAVCQVLGIGGVNLWMLQRIVDEGNCYAVTTAIPDERGRPTGRTITVRHDKRVAA